MIAINQEVIIDPAKDHWGENIFRHFVIEICHSKPMSYYRITNSDFWWAECSLIIPGLETDERYDS